MTNPDGLENMDLDNWPHQFTKNGAEVQVSEQRLEGSGIKIPVFAIPMICVHCHVEYKQGVDAVPPGPCPARNGKREMKRILNT